MSVTRSHALSGPISSVPDDVLLEIFAFCIPEKRSIISATKSPILISLTHVCRRWRDVAQSIPSFWSSLSVRRNDLNPTSLKMLQTWLKNGRHLPIDFQLVATDKLKDKIDGLSHQLHYQLNSTRLYEHFGAIVNDLKTLRTTAHNRLMDCPSRYLTKLLKPVSSNITRLALNDVPIEELTALPRRAFPNLERLVLGISSKREWDRFSWTDHGDIKAFAHRPSPLTHVAIRRFYRGDGQDHVLLPWKQLTHFIDYAPSEDHSQHFFRAVLPACSERLRYLSITLYDSDAAHTISKRRLACLTNLHALNIRIPKGCSYPGFLDAFDFPSVHTLRISAHNVKHPERWFAPGRFPNLTHLTLSLEQGFSRRHLVSVLEALPQLTSLEVPFTLDAFGIVAYSTFAPNLTHVTFVYFHPTEVIPSDEAIDDDYVEPFNYLVNHPVRGNIRHVHFVWHASLVQEPRAEAVLLEVFKDFEEYSQLPEVVEKIRAKGLEEVLVTNEIVETVGCDERLLDILLRDKAIEGWNGIRDLGEAKS